jgi:hypothetical protein
MHRVHAVEQKLSVSTVPKASVVAELLLKVT